MDHFNVLHNHHMQARVIHPHRAEFIQETGMTQTSQKAVASFHTAWIRCFIGLKHAYGVFEVQTPFYFVATWLKSMFSPSIDTKISKTLEIQLRCLPLLLSGSEMYRVQLNGISTCSECNWLDIICKSTHLSCTADYTSRQEPDHKVEGTASRNRIALKIWVRPHKNIFAAFKFPMSTVVCINLEWKKFLVSLLRQTEKSGKQGY